MTKVFIASCENGPGAWTHQAEALRAVFPANDPSLELAQRPDEAEIILISDLRDRGDHFANLRNHPLVQKFPNRCFSVSEDDFPPIWLRGIHTSAKKARLKLRRFCSGSYFLYHPDFKNAFVAEFAKNPAQMPEKKYLFSFLGRSCNELRAQLFATKFRRRDIVVRDTSRFNNFSHDQTGKEEARAEYAKILAQSKFALCPRGNGAASIRLYEAMSLGIAPIIVADDWLLPRGPNWNEFALFVSQESIDKVEQIAERHESEWAARGKLAREAYERYFTGTAYLRYLVDCALHIRKNAILPESLVLKTWPSVVLASKVRFRVVHKIRKLTKR